MEKTLSPTDIQIQSYSMDKIKIWTTPDNCQVIGKRKADFICLAFNIMSILRIAEGLPDKTGYGQRVS